MVPWNYSPAMCLSFETVHTVQCGTVQVTAECLAYLNVGIILRCTFQDDYESVDL